MWFKFDHILSNSVLKRHCSLSVKKQANKIKEPKWIRCLVNDLYHLKYLKCADISIYCSF